MINKMITKVKDKFSESFGFRAAIGLGLKKKIKVHYTFDCYDKEGNIKWHEEMDNLVVDVGMNKMLDMTFFSGTASPAWYLFLKHTGTVAAADTMASHAGWTEATPYSNANRPTWTPNGAASGKSTSNSSAKAVFNFNATDADIAGAGMTDNNTKGGSTGTLYGAADFGAARGVASGDTLTLQVDISLS